MFYIHRNKTTHLILVNEKEELEDCVLIDYFKTEKEVVIYLRGYNAGLEVCKYL